MQIIATVTGLYIGKARERWDGKPPSAIGKEAVRGPLELGLDGFEDDEQADRAVHGGPEKALHHYPADHYAYWAARWPEHAERLVAGGFGENISTFGVTEADVCLGDRFRIGSTLVEICQGRQPCWKLPAHTGIDEMAMAMQKSGRTGWYYRVLEGGRISVGDTMELTARPCPDWPLDKVVAARFDPRLDPSVAAAIAALAPLSASWRAAFEKKSKAGFSEDTTARLNGD